ncbi:hypothetical protein C8A03DRAFT_38763 [Achaetomium macrosporum]|uniref:Uncharacterized protein n=1 Tax=Achaetomium macrosporum TaxID=79813 RepID=A0AAN7C1F1_9PEZI|nr:hypothetical protein C8A03DRAFT_38763 [Achaetomium macrosporum]
MNNALRRFQEWLGYGLLQRPKEMVTEQHSPSEHNESCPSSGMIAEDAEEMVGTQGEHSPAADSRPGDNPAPAQSTPLPSASTPPSPQARTPTRTYPGLDPPPYHATLVDTEPTAVIKAIGIAVCTAADPGRSLEAIPDVAETVAKTIVGVANLVAAVPVAERQAAATTIAAAFTNYAARFDDHEVRDVVPEFLMNRFHLTIGRIHYIVATAPASTAPAVAFAVATAVTVVANAIAVAPYESEYRLAIEYGGCANRMVDGVRRAISTVASARLPP